MAEYTFQRKLTFEDRKKIRELHATGIGLNQLAKMYKIDHSTIWYHLHKRKVTQQRKVIKRYKVKALTFSDYQAREQKRVKKQIQCNHPSFKCGICQKWYDNSREQIMSLDRADC